MSRPHAAQLLVHVLAACVVAACGRSLQPLDTPPPGRRALPYVPRVEYVIPDAAWAALKAGIVPSISFVDGPRGDRGEIVMGSYTINGFRADDWNCIDADDGPESLKGSYRLCPIHPYLLVRGENRVHVEEDGFELAVLRWDYLGSRSHTELARLGPGRDGVFDLDLALPEWPWVRGRPIADTPENFAGLRAEVQKFHDALAALQPGAAASPERPQPLADVRRTTAAFIRASELRGKPYEFLDELLAAAAGQPIGSRPADSVRLMPLAAASGLELMAGGALARLATLPNDPLITLDSTYDDGQFGAQGGTIVACDLWYRQGDAGEWILDAVVPVQSTAITRRFEASQISEHNLRELFRATAF